LAALLSFQNNIYVQKALKGIQAASVGLILIAAIKLGKTVLHDKLGWTIALVSFIMIIFLNINAAWAVVGGAIVGYLTYLLKRSKKQ
jgi:chromate transporter